MDDAVGALAGRIAPLNISSPFHPSSAQFEGSDSTPPDGSGLDFGSDPADFGGDLPAGFDDLPDATGLRDFGLPDDDGLDEPPAPSSSSGKKAKQVKGKSCHQCKNTKTPEKLAYCTNLFNKRNKADKRLCHKKYCEGCLRKFYFETVDGAKKTPNWICASCRNICQCASCLRKSGKAPANAAQANNGIDLQPLTLLLQQTMKNMYPNAAASTPASNPLAQAIASLQHLVKPQPQTPNVPQAGGLPPHLAASLGAAPNANASMLLALSSLLQQKPSQSSPSPMQLQQQIQQNVQQQLQQTIQQVLGQQLLMQQAQAPQQPQPNQSLAQLRTLLQLSPDNYELLQMAMKQAGAPSMSPSPPGTPLSPSPQSSPVHQTVTPGSAQTPSQQAQAQAQAQLSQMAVRLQPQHAQLSIQIHPSNALPTSPLHQLPTSPQTSPIPSLLHSPLHQQPVPQPHSAHPSSSSNQLLPPSAQMLFQQVQASTLAAPSLALPAQPQASSNLPQQIISLLQSASPAVIQALVAQGSLSPQLLSQLYAQAEAQSGPSNPGQSASASASLVDPVEPAVKAEPLSESSEVKISSPPEVEGSEPQAQQYLSSAPDRQDNEEYSSHHSGYDEWGGSQRIGMLPTSDHVFTTSPDYIARSLSSGVDHDGPVNMAFLHPTPSMPVESLESRSQSSFSSDDPIAMQLQSSPALESKHLMHTEVLPEASSMHSPTFTLTRLRDQDFHTHSLAAPAPRSSVLKKKGLPFFPRAPHSPALHNRAALSPLSPLSPFFSITSPLPSSDSPDLLSANSPSIVSPAPLGRLRRHKHRLVQQQAHPLRLSGVKEDPESKKSTPVDSHLANEMAFPQAPWELDSDVSPFFPVEPPASFLPDISPDESPR